MTFNAFCGMDAQLHAVLLASLLVSQDSCPHSLSHRGAEKLELRWNLGFLTSVQINCTGAKTPKPGSQKLATKQVELASLVWQGFGTITSLFERDLPGRWLWCHLSMEVLFLSKAFNSGLMNDQPSWSERKVVKMLLLFPSKKCHYPWPLFNMFLRFRMKKQKRQGFQQRPINLF